MRAAAVAMGWALVGLSGGCGGDGGAAPPGASCADPAAVPIFPAPAWLEGATLAAPAGDRVAALIAEARPEWLPAVAAIDGWPRLGELIVPLSGAATAAAGDRVTVYGLGADGWQPYPVPFDARVEAEPPTLILRPQIPYPPGIDEVILAIGAGAAAGARALPACGADGRPHPAYAEAASAVAADAELAIRLQLATTAEALPRLGQVLDAASVLEVESVAPRALGDFDAPPPAEVAAALASEAAVGILALPDYRDAAGVIGLDEGGVPVAVGVTRPGFVVALPASGTPPHPFVLFQHGGGQDKADFLQWAAPLGSAGFAVVAIDLPYHGDRAEVGGGSDLDFLKFDDPLGTRDNFRQAVADHLAVLGGTDALNAAIAQSLGVSEALDRDRGFYMGLSLGGISGSLTFASAARLRGGALFVAGAGYSEMVTHGLFSVLFNDVMQRPPVEATTVLAFMEVLLDGADPAAYGQHVEDRGAPPRPALFMQAVDDTILSMATNDRLGRLYGAAVALPVDHPVEGMEELALPAADNFAWSAQGARATRVLVHNPMAEVAPTARHPALITLGYAQEMVTHCFATLLASGSCEVIDTGFAAH
jgi:hypothetical protein